MASSLAHQTPIWWRSCLATAFRTALACSIVAVGTLFGPPSFKRHVAYPAWSFVTVIIIIGADGTLGDALRGVWYALYATCQGVGPAMLSLWLIGPTRLTVGGAAAAVGLTAFIVALPDNAHFVAKRIALGQTVIIYTIALANSGKIDPLMHPLHIAASTAAGAAASVLALLLPYPGLASSEVKHNCKLLAENVSERLNLLVKAFSAEDNTSSLSLVSQARSLAAQGSKFLQNIKSKQESMQWERYPIKFLRPYCKNPGERMQEYETPLRGLEIALLADQNNNKNNKNSPKITLASELKDSLENLTQHISKQVKNNTPFDSVTTTVPESTAQNAVEFFQTLHNTIKPITTQELPSLFFLFCLKLMLKRPLISPPKDGLSDNENSKKQGERFLTFLRSMKNNRRLIGAFKASLSLGLAVFFGLVYSRQNGIWAGLPVAISYVAAREATFKIANVKAQGTVLGSIYGVLGCFVFEKYSQFRFVSLIPWFILCNLLRRSRMYGHAGGISACIGAVLILGRRGFGPPSQFAIARITETFIGLSSSILVEILLHPRRASSLAKIELSRSLDFLSESVGLISLVGEKTELEQRITELKQSVVQLGKFVSEADVEPNFWFLPFHSACYGKLMLSLSKSVEYLRFVGHALRFLEQESSGKWKESMDNHLCFIKDSVSDSIKQFEEVISSVGSIQALENEFEKNKSSVDIESGKLPAKNVVSGEEIEEKLESCVDVLDDVDDDEVKSQVVLSLSALVFCVREIVRESREIEKGIKELVQCENPSSPVNLHDISCKLRALAHTTTVTI